MGKIKYYSSISGSPIESIFVNVAKYLFEQTKHKTSEKITAILTRLSQRQRSPVGF